MTADDRMALRVGALRRARRRQSIGEGAWAASRLRLRSVALEQSDATFARDAIVRFGRMIRIARSRRPTAGSAPLAVASPIRARTVSRWRIVAILLALAVVVLVVMLSAPARPTEEASGGGSPASAGAAPTASPLRGRSDQVVALIPVVATPAPTETASATPAATAASGQVPGASSGGQGTSVGPGNGSGAPGTARPTPTPTATPTAAPTRTVDPATLMFLRGRVVDASTRRGVPFTCIAIGVLTCAGAPTTDANGFFEVALSVGQSWDIRFIKNGYGTYLLRLTSVRAGTYTIPDIELRAR